MKEYGSTQRQALFTMYQPPRRVKMRTTPHRQTLNSSQNTLNTLNTLNKLNTCHKGHNTGENTPVELSWGHSSQLLRHKILRQLSANPLSSLGNPGAEHVGNPGGRQVGSNPREARQSPQILCNPSLPHRIPAGRAKSLNITTMVLSRIQFLWFNKILRELSPGLSQDGRLNVLIMIVFKYILIYVDLINLKRWYQLSKDYPGPPILSKFFWGASISLLKVYPSPSQELAAVYKGGRQSIKERANLYYPLVDWLEKHTLPDKRNVSKHWIFNKARKLWYHLQWFCLRI